MSNDVIEFRFGPRSRWERVPEGYTVPQALALFANYQLRINGEIQP